LLALVDADLGAALGEDHGGCEAAEAAADDGDLDRRGEAVREALAARVGVVGS
jgi:hypothetical protein